MNRRLSRYLFILGLAAAFVAQSCGGGSESSVTPAADPTIVATTTSTPGPTPGATATPANVPQKLGTSTGTDGIAKAPDFEALPGATARFGMLGKSAYRIELPNNWNHELVLWAHGWRGPGKEVSVDFPRDGLRNTLIDEGYAWAASSFSENGPTGYVPGIGADDTLDLKHFFEQTVGKPKRTYIVGESMGGNVVALSLENFPSEYDGALAVCGALGGEEQIDYLVSWNRLAEYVSRGKIAYGPGTSFEQATMAMGQITTALGAADAPTDSGRQFLSLIRMLTGGPRPFFIEGVKQQWLLNFAVPVIDPEGKTFLLRAATNEGAVYAIEPGLGLTSEQVNAGVVRQKADPDARNAALHPDLVPTTGKIGVPLMTLHNTGDLFVPVAQEQAYRKKVEAAGKGDLLVQRAIRGAGHCNFSDQELTTAWNDLRAWVANGQKPKGDDLSGDLTDIGRQFTNPIRPGDPGTK